VTFTVTVLLSGAGSTLAALLHATQHGAPFTIGHVISNTLDAAGVRLANSAGIPTTVLPRVEFTSLSEQKAAVLEATKRGSPDLVVLAGFMMVLQQEFIESFPRKVVNIHPSLLPKYPGLDTHQRALDGKESEHGSSVHFVDCGVDTGPLIAQVRVPILPEDSAASLKERVQAREREVYPWVISALACREIKAEERGIWYSERVLAEAAQRGYSVFPMS
jgi:phosphoribosylglycinamide formyltransferase-1